MASCKYYVTDDIEWIKERYDLKGLNTIAMVESTRTLNNKTSVHNRLYISSLPAKAETLAQTIRSHWSIENSLHWVLDLSFNEDQSRVRDRNASGNMALIRHTALNSLKTVKPLFKKYSLKGLRRAAGWDNNILDTIVSHNFITNS